MTATMEPKKKAKRGTSNTNSRGSAEDRRRRKQFVLDRDGDGVQVKCCTCPTMLTFDTITIDRHPILGVDGGTYSRDNIRGQCQPCASLQGAYIGNERKRLKKESCENGLRRPTG